MHLVLTKFKLLESQSTHFTDLYDIMNFMRRDLKTRASDKFYGFEVHQALKNLTQHEQDVFCTDAEREHERSVQYLEKLFPFDSSSLMALSVLCLRREFSFGELMRAVDVTGLELDGDNLYDEFDILHSAMPNLLAQDQPAALKWVEFFKSCDGSNLLKLVEFFLFPSATPRWRGYSRS